MPDTRTLERHRPPVLVIATAITVAILVALSGCSSGSEVAVNAEGAVPAPSDGDSEWETFHEFGRWTLRADRQTIQIERMNVRSSCADHRVVVVDESSDQWLLQFETRITAKDCLAVGCVDCSQELALDRVVPPEVEVHAVCDPSASIFATTIPGGAQVTLRQSDGTEVVACSPVPEPTGTLTSTTVQAPREHTAAEVCTEPPEGMLTTSGFLSVEPGVVSAGHEMTFRWAVEGQGMYTVGDEIVVWCWSGADWVPAWVTYAVFTDPVSVLITPDSDAFTITDDGFQESSGTIVVPDEAAPGTYRVADTISFDSEDGRSEREAGQAFFVVVD